MNPDLGPIIACCFFIVPILAYLAHALYFRIQARMHEFMLTLVVSTLPLGLILMRMRDIPRPEPLDLPKGIVAGLFPALMLLSGSIWGLSAARRLQEGRAWVRLGIMVVGWLVFPASIALLIALISFLFGEPARPFFIGLASAIPLYTAYHIERACRSKVVK